MEDPNFDEFSASLKFLVTQYSTLLYSPDGYTVDVATSEVHINDSCFSSITDATLQPKLDILRKQLKEKLQHDLNVRKERRDSLSGRPRTFSGGPVKRNSKSSAGGLPKASRIATFNTTK